MTVPVPASQQLGERLYAALKHSHGCSCGECSGGLNAVDALVSLAARTEEAEAALRELVAWSEGGGYRLPPGSTSPLMAIQMARAVLEASS